MFNFEYSLADHNFERKLEEQLKNERILDEPSCRASMKKFGNKRMIKEREVENTR